MDNVITSEKLEMEIVKRINAFNIDSSFNERLSIIGLIQTGVLFELITESVANEFIRILESRTKIWVLITTGKHIGKKGYLKTPNNFVANSDREVTVEILGWSVRIPASKLFVYEPEQAKLTERFKWGEVNNG